jgi:integrase
MGQLTDAVIRKLKPPAAGNRITYDDAVRGFGVRVTAAGARSFIFNYRVRDSGRERRITIGTVGAWTTVQAREEAKRLRQDIERGLDPLGAIEEARAEPTVHDLADRFEKEHLPRRRPSTAELYESALRKYIRPAFGNRRVAEVRFEDVDAMHRHVTKEGGPYVANRSVAVASKMFSLAIRWRMRSDNPAKGVEKNPESKRKRYLSADELVRLTAALASYPDQTVANIVRLLLMTGARSGEIFGMRWADLDLAAGTWTKPASTTKQKADHVVPLSAPARHLLTEIRDKQASAAPRKPLGEFVFPGPAGHVTTVKKSWRAICGIAGITGLRVHDLRHSFASQLASGGASLPLIGALLGHSNPTTTARYSHLFDDPLRTAVERVGAIVTGQPAAEVVPIKRSAQIVAGS